MIYEVITQTGARFFTDNGTIRALPLPVTVQAKPARAASNPHTQIAEIRRALGAREQPFPRTITFYSLDHIIEHAE